MSTKNISGQRFGRLFVVREYTDEERNGKRYCGCMCDCGKSKEIYKYSITSGRTQSCGCLHVERASNNSNLKHGHARAGKKSREFLAWQEMHRRCYDPKRDRYPNYGGRGICVCPRWHKFENFLHDMRRCPDGLTLGRLDNDKNYTKNNCEWQPRLIQANNKSTTHFITHDGKTMSLADWARESCVPYTVLISRINKLKWSFADAVSTPPRPHR